MYDTCDELEHHCDELFPSASDVEDLPDCQGCCYVVGAAALGGVIAMAQAIHDRIEEREWEEFYAACDRAEAKRASRVEAALRDEWGTWQW